MLIDILKRFNIDFCIVNEENMSDIILMLPYSPFTFYPKNCIQLDAFYFASNQLYNTTKEIKQVLKDNNYTIIDRVVNLKKQAEKGGLGSIVNNQLLANSKYGTRTTLQSISVLGSYECKANGAVNVICEKCGKCDKICPNGALNKGIFTRDKCVRHIQDFPDVYQKSICGKFLGCDECQKICPYNSKVESVQMSEDLQEMLDYNNVFAMIKEGKKSLLKLGNIIGHNYARPTYLFNLAVNSLLSAKNFEYTDIIKTFSNHQSESIRNKVEYYFKIIAQNNDFTC